MFKWVDNNCTKNAIVLLFKKNDVNYLNYDYINKLNERKYKTII